MDVQSDFVHFRALLHHTMIIKSITPLHFGPFTDDATLEVDPRVTVLTGPNDSGKSSLLQLIRIACQQSVIEENHLNRSRAEKYTGPWNTDPEAGCRIAFVCTELSRKCLPPQQRDIIQPGDVLWLRLQLAEQARLQKIEKIVRGNVTTHHDLLISRFPKVFMLPDESNIRDVIKLPEMTTTEASLIAFGFGSGFTFNNHKTKSPHNRSVSIRAAERRLNEKLARMFPNTLGIKLELHEVAGEPESLGVAVVDAHEGFTPLGSRGTGIRRLLSLLVKLLALDIDSEHVYILLDEPETSLHADSQHFLRRFLESLAENPTVQVIYATHSPSMINVMRPSSIRLLSRERAGNIAKSFINNKCFDSNFYRIRSSLGISPADSLLYAAVTVVVEGETEVNCIPLLLTKFFEAAVPGFGDLESILSQSHFLDGRGDQFEYICSLAKSQNGRTILFLDGDKRSNVLKDFEKRHPDIPIITLALGTEIENIVPKERYIEALADVMFKHFGIDKAELTFEMFDAWCVGKGDRIFSKQVEYWLYERHGKKMKNKSQVLEQAIIATDVDKIEQQDNWRRLVDAMRTALHTVGIV